MCNHGNKELEKEEAENDRIEHIHGISKRDCEGVWKSWDFKSHLCMKFCWELRCSQQDEFLCRSKSISRILQVGKISMASLCRSQCYWSKKSIHAAKHCFMTCMKKKFQLGE